MIWEFCLNCERLRNDQISNQGTSSLSSGHLRLNCAGLFQWRCFCAVCTETEKSFWSCVRIAREVSKQTNSDCMGMTALGVYLDLHLSPTLAPQHRWLRQTAFLPQLPWQWFPIKVLFSRFPSFAATIRKEMKRVVDVLVLKTGKR